MEKKKIVLKPCPFCGMKPTILTADTLSGIVCPDSSPCKGSGLAFIIMDSEEKAIECWNRREGR